MPKPLKKENFASKIKMGEEGTFSGIAMTVGIPEGRPYFDFTKEAVADQVGKEVMLILDHSQGETLKTIGRAKFTSFDGKNLMFEAQLLMSAKDVAENVYPRIKEKILDGVSVGVEFNDYEEKKDGNLLIKGFSIRELSVVPFPAFTKAKIKKAFSANADMKQIFSDLGVELSEEVITSETLSKLTLRQFECILKEIGFAKTVATKLASLSKDLLGEHEDQKQGELAADDIINHLKSIVN